MRASRLAVAVLASLWACAAHAESFEDLEGKSIVYDYRDNRTLPNGTVDNEVWSGKVYVAPDGRVFFRHHGVSHFGVNGSESQQVSFDTEGDRDGNGNGRRTNYRWDGNGFSRSWTVRGVQVTQVVSVQGGRCQASIERTPDPGTTTGHSGSCRIVSGNALH